ncbi:MAG: KUP/HAK/KT family potassium transporter [Flavobacteriales bacterium]|nr:KUP/HAK/KT family potassium transporter [Flavobacteriales bacterium]MBK6753792.1 KUP/HAK/KT family potassium transporter [Flavobacteriales bacterium]MBK7268279.1 KUP/HAK/KT family potassium transporter [Flavobacteriales bacterium]MBK7751066.1 KUP/HAK/KT family potassium transporter [Flavobacteriales bacterium]MBK9073409.1 KUP/HAK/KT family potassium transporter [Flavobacteriales bacterium]
MPQTSKHTHPLTVAGLLVTLGIIYGDIGTSPLYVFKAIIGETTPITNELVLGALSCIIWTLTLQTSFKYILLTLRADNRGEGGVFSLYTLVRRYGKWVYLPAMIGAATLLADGILTPPISVASAIEGLGGVPAFAGTIAPGNGTTVLLVMVIISFLFFFQRFGTKVVGYSFGPIMLVWFSMLLVLGLAQIVRMPQVLACVDPRYAVRLLTVYPGGFWLLGAVFLCTTGAEGLYNDMGHCGRKNIQATWVFVKTALVCNYMGQGAWLLQHEGQLLGHVNPFYEVMPQWFLIIGVGIATLAAVVACQAVISGSFTLINEAITLNFWPKVKVKFPTEIRGQIYIPSVNWLLWSGCMGVMLYFRSSDEMEAAYGFFIVVAMLMTTVLLYGYLRYVRRWHFALVFLVMGIFFSLEIANFIANAVKIIHRPYLLLAVFLILAVMFIWFRARKITNRFLEFVPLSQYARSLRDLSDDKEIPKYATHLVYLTKADNPRNVEKQVMDSILARKVKRADIYWFVHVNYTDEPYTMEYRVKELIDDKVIRVDFDLGFRVQARINMLFRRVMEEMESEHELEFRNKYESIKKGDFHTDICYVLTERILSVENEFDFRKDAILDAYYALKHLALGDREAFGLDPNVTVIEQVPLVISAAPPVPLERVGRPK